MLYCTVGSSLQAEHFQDHIHPNEEGYKIISRDLTEFLLAKGYTVHGIIRRSSSFNTGSLRIGGLPDRHRSY